MKNKSLKLGLSTEEEELVPQESLVYEQKRRDQYQGKVFYFGDFDYMEESYRKYY